MNSKTVVIIAAILAVSLGGYFLLTNKPVTKTPTTTPTPSSEVIPELVVEGSDFKFNPAQISFQAGEKVKLIFKNTGEARHDFVIEGLNTRTKLIVPGTSDTVEFIAPDTGTYTFYCSVPGHRQAGMEGKLVTN